MNSPAPEHNAPHPSQSAAPLDNATWYWGRALAWMLAAAVLGACAAWATSFLLPVKYTATTSLLPPQQQRSSAVSALASLGAIAGLGSGAMASPADQYVSLMQSATVSDRLIDEFGLLKVYGLEYKVDARTELAKNSNFSVGRKDNLIVIRVDDIDPYRAAQLANRYVDELKKLTGTLAVSEAQQRRVFFEQELNNAKNKLSEAQIALESSGFSEGSLRSEPKAAAEGYARIQAELTAAEIQLRKLRTALADDTPEVRSQISGLQSLRAELARMERNAPTSNSPGYIARYREFKYRETLFELFSRQYEMARVDESREGALIQVVDPAVRAEKPSQPRRARIAAAGAALGLLLVIVVWSARTARRRSTGDQPP